MNVKRTILILLALLTVLAMTSCDMITTFIESRTRPITVIEIFNGNLEKTLKMVPNDTLYVRVKGLAPNAEHTVQVLDPLKKVVSKVVTDSNEDGEIDMTPLWYDIGLKIKPADDPLEPGRIYLDNADLSVSAFYIQVIDNLDIPKTDFELSFFFISTNEDLERQQPIVMSGKVVSVESEDVFIPWNAFYSKEQNLDDITYIDEDGVEVEDPTAYEAFTKTLYVKIDQLEPLTEGSDDEVRIWILPTRGDEPYLDGESIGESAYSYQDFKVSDFENDGYVKIKWPQILPGNAYAINVDDLDNYVNEVTQCWQEEIPEWAEMRDFSIIADMPNPGLEDFGIYETMKEGFTSYYLDGIDGNGLAGFIVKSKEVPDVITSMQLASNGIYNGVDWHWNITDNGYVDTFKQNGSDTHGYYGWYYYPKGLKVSWNPYVSKAYYYCSSTEGEGDELSEYVGQYVDVYVVRASQELGEGTTIANYAVKRTIPIQFSCRNGARMQTIWRAPYGGYNSIEVLGDYIMIVDMDRDGEISDGDLVDDVRKDADPDKGGFSIIAN